MTALNGQKAIECYSLMRVVCERIFILEQWWYLEAISFTNHTLITYWFWVNGGFGTNLSSILQFIRSSGARQGCQKASHHVPPPSWENNKCCTNTIIVGTESVTPLKNINFQGHFGLWSDESVHLVNWLKSTSQISPTPMDTKTQDSQPNPTSFSAPVAVRQLNRSKI